ncbi:uncharacterized protein EI90DRAFT_3035711 [Cantharellus anzutake]|uniref:uncharacterized protein n=1 Tax=Cantharellus anzutake TaxID=1750568 RepID=UPI001907B97A|nr:uncharacterized protein EI90DRAFT_3035711 [Cantharellus anzutake]KAF8340478.1 hypothetical protein EI90DRAFT_3035711 [Cantharellus anzutake]
MWAASFSLSPTTRCATPAHFPSPRIFLWSLHLGPLLCVSRAAGMPTGGSPSTRAQRIRDLIGLIRLSSSTQRFRCWIQQLSSSLHRHYALLSADVVLAKYR